MQLVTKKGLFALLLLQTKLRSSTKIKKLLHIIAEISLFPSYHDKFTFQAIAELLSLIFANSHFAFYFKEISLFGLSIWDVKIICLLASSAVIKRTLSPFLIVDTSLEETYVTILIFLSLVILG